MNFTSRELFGVDVCKVVANYYLISRQLLLNYLNSLCSQNQTSLPKVDDEEHLVIIHDLLEVMAIICKPAGSKRKFESEEDEPQFEYKVNLGEDINTLQIKTAASKYINEASKQISVETARKSVFRPPIEDPDEKFKEDLAKNSPQVFLKLDSGFESFMDKKPNTDLVNRILIFVLKLLASDQGRLFFQDFCNFKSNDHTMNLNNLVEKYKSIKTEITIKDIAVLFFLSYEFAETSDFYYKVEQKCSHLISTTTRDKF